MGKVSLPTVNFVTSIKEQFKRVAASGVLDDHEAAIVQELWETRHGGSLSQAQLAKRVGWMGSHVCEPVRTVESTLRKVRQVIRTLRVTHGLPILAESDGYYIPRNETEARDYLSIMEREAKARAASSLETYRALRKSLGVTNAFLDALDHDDHV